MPDLAEFLILKKFSVHGFDERNTQGSKCTPRFRQLQHLSVSRQKTSHPQEKQSPHFVLRSSRKVPKIFTLVLSENGGGCFGVVQRKHFPPCAFFQHRLQDPCHHHGQQSPPWTLLCGQIQWKPTINWEFMWKGTSGSGGRGQKGDSAQEGSTPQLPGQGRAARLLPWPPPCSSSQTTARPRHHPRSHRSRNVPKYLKKATPA